MHKTVCFSWVVCFGPGNQGLQDATLTSLLHKKCAKNMTHMCMTAQITPLKHWLGQHQRVLALHMRGVRFQLLQLPMLHGLHGLPRLSLLHGLWARWQPMHNLLVACVALDGRWASTK